jgi:L,D-peptidoglycan transpeptidase YkuD (ErfK/YbiS/YcfS/YnhG family)
MLPRRDDLVVARGRLGFRGRSFPCRVGRGGVVDRARKREGDGATPAGVHRIVGLLYRPGRVAKAALPRWAVPLGPSDLWSDDPADPDYNLMVRAPHGYGHERLTRADPQYDIILVTDWNWPQAQAGRGSAIFVHIRRGPGHPTAGCVALARADLLWIVRRIAYASRLVVRG